MKNPQRKNTSLITKLSALIAGILLMMLGLCAGITIYSYQVVNETVVDAQERTMLVAYSQLSGSLQSATHMLTETMMDYIANADDYMAANSLNRYLASRRMANLLDTKMASNPMVDCVFFSNTASLTLLARYQPRVNYAEKFAVGDFIADTDAFANDAITGEWHLAQVNDRYYLLQFYRLQYGGLGALVSLDNLLASNEALSVEQDVRYVLTDAAGTVLTSGTDDIEKGSILHNVEKVNFSWNERKLLISMDMPVYQLRLSCSKTPSGLLYGPSWIPFLFMGFSLAAVALVVFSSLYMRREILLPIGNLVKATKMIENGDLDYVIKDNAVSAEFTTLITSFNYMTKEVKNQKIKIYEEEISRQKAELKFLQLQLRPHFYLNAINTISSLSRQGRNEEIQKFITALSSYLRYLFTDAGGRATVQSEVQHAVDFMKLQQVKYPNLIFYMSEVESAVQNVPMPKLLIQTFAENIFKHAFDGETMLSVFIRAQKTGQNEDICRITIEDSGCGFPLEYLKGLAENEKSVGIRNIRQTLKLVYGREDLLQISNSEQGGARIVLLIPKERKLPE